MDPSPSRLTLLNDTTRRAPFPSSDSIISHIDWSSDSEYVLAASSRLGFVNIYKMRDEEWSARIEAGAEGLVKAEWAPDGRNIICFSDWGLRVTIWSLLDGTASYIQFPVHPEKGYTFRSDGRYFLLAERHKSKDTIGVYDAADSYKLVRHIPLLSYSTASISLSPTGNHLAVWEGIFEAKLYIYSLGGRHLATFIPSDSGTTIKCVTWHPSGSFIAVGGSDSKVYILDSISWSDVCVVNMLSKIPVGVTVWREPASWLENTLGRGFLSYERLQKYPSNAMAKATDRNRTGSSILEVEWNKTGNMFFLRSEVYPNALFIYSFPSTLGGLSIELRTLILQIEHIHHVQWNPVRAGNLALCCSNNGLYVWSNEWTSDMQPDHVEGMAECIGIPAKEFHLRDFKWSPDGKGLLLLDKEAFCGAFEVGSDGV